MDSASCIFPVPVKTGMKGKLEFELEMEKCILKVDTEFHSESSIGIQWGYYVTGKQMERWRGKLNQETPSPPLALDKW